MTNPNYIDKVIESEEKLRLAMLQSDVQKLDELLASDLIFINHLGHLMSKQDDLDAHQSGMLKIEQITPSEQQVKIIDNVATVTVRVSIKGFYAGTYSENDFRFTRVWVRSSKGTWNVVAAHSSLVT